MDLSRLRSRRNILGLAIAGALTRVVPVRAVQLNAGCEYGITNGLVTIGGDDCDLPVPQQMIDARTNADGNDSILGTTSSQGTSTTGTDTTSTPSTTTSTTSPQAERQARLQKRRSKKRRKRGRTTDKKQTKKGRKHTRKQERIEAQITCEDFNTQKEAIEWLAQHPEDAAALDPDGNKLACVELTKLSCSQFTDAKDAKQWLRFYGFVTGDNFASEPFGLYDGTDICPAKG